jgi:phage-related protein
MHIETYPEVRKFISDLQPEQRGKALRAIERLKAFGQLLPLPHSKKIDHKLWELRVRGKIQVRLLYTFAHNKIHIVSGFVKKSPKIPRRELELARQRIIDIA